MKAEQRIPVTGCAKRFLMVDRNGTQIHVGDRIRYQYCSGRYGQTAIGETIVTESHYQYGSIGNAAFRFDFKTDQLVGKHSHNDFEHGHQTWVEVLP